jgi:hypothetical protein
MRQEEKTAQRLVAALRAIGIESLAKGAGFHWHVEVEGRQSRSVLIHCFWYERHIAGLMMGMNPANARQRSPSFVPSEPYEGPEYQVNLKESGGNIADGRTYQEAEAIAAIQSWCAGHPLSQLITDALFIDAKGRAMRALAARLDPGLWWELGGDPSYELWVHAGDRSCKVLESDGKLFCYFRLVQAQVAYSDGLSEVVALISSWLLSRMSLEALSRSPGVALEAHAEWIESSPAKWHWMHVRDRIADPDDVLAPMKDLLEALAEHPLATTFYSFSSLNMFCFSASSHYPWVNEGLPVVSPSENGEYTVNNERCTREQAIQRIESILAASPIRPFFGSEDHYDLPRLNDCFARIGSTLRGELIPRGAWYSLVVSRGSRRCTVSGYYVELIEGSAKQSVSWSTLEDAARGICRWLEDGASIDDIVSDPKAKRR